MAFKKREYNFYKKLCKQSMRNTVNHELYGCAPIFPPSILLGMLPDYIAEQNFEACKAIEDTIREWFAEQGIEIPADATIKIPQKSTEEIHGIISLADPDDPSGMASRGTIWF
jgi:hypothetical protein